MAIVFFLSKKTKGSHLSPDFLFKFERDYVCFPEVNPLAAHSGMLHKSNCSSQEQTSVFQGRNLCLILGAKSDRDSLFFFSEEGGGVLRVVCRASDGLGSASQ